MHNLKNSNSSVQPPWLKAALVLILGGLLAACSASASCPVATAESAEKRHLYVVHHRWHTGIIIPGERLPADLAFLRQHLPRADHYEFGWGDAAFYRDPGEPVGKGLRALFWPTDSVLHVAAIDREPARMPYTDLQAVTVSPESLERLGEAVAASFYRDEQGRTAPIGPGRYGESRFYRARGTFWFAANCNTWTVSMLHNAGLPTGFLPKLTAGSVMRLSRRISEECNGAATGPDSPP